MRFIDLFSGLGGFHLAGKKLGHNCVFASEIDDNLRELYKENFGILPKGDIRDINIADIPDHDLLCAGFPCQPFSKAGDQKGWKDAVRGTVFFEIVKILENKRPEYVLLENVANFKRHDNGNTYQRVKQAFESLNYEVTSDELSPHEFGIPQIRKRFYLFAQYNGIKNFNWPEPTNEDVNIESILDPYPEEAEYLDKKSLQCLEVWQEFIENFPKDESLASFPIWSMEFGATYPFEKNDDLYEIELEELRSYKGAFGKSLDYWYREDVLNQVPNYASYEKNSFPTWKKRFIRGARKIYKENKSWLDDWIPKIKQFPSSYKKLEWNCKDEKRNIWDYIIQFRASGVRVKRSTTSPSLIAMTTSQIPIIGWEKRYMTLKECSRLQSMEELEHLPRRNLAMKALGNAVNVNLIKRIMAKIETDSESNEGVVSNLESVR